jgi:UDP-glucose:(heptosyl)LPS alpha-1,3-glucosyltransferase
MRLALIRQRYNPYGGAERFVARALEALRGQGVAVTVIARQWDMNGDLAGGASAGGPALELVRCDPYYLGRLWRDASFGRAACRAAAEGSFDLVQSHERIACCDIYRAGDGVHAQWLDNRRRALGCWGRLGIALNPYHAYVQRAERRLFSSPSLRAVICNSRMVAEEIRRRFAVSESRLHVIYNGVDLEAFNPRLRERYRAAMRARLGIAADDMLYLMVGSGFERKGVPQLLEALARPGNARARLVIVGADRRTGALRRRADALGVGPRVTFAGPQRDVEPWYGTADCFVLPTLYDPFPNAALEAMAAGLPVITSSSCGAAELVVNGQSGFVCEALDIKELAEGMASIDPASARAMGERARAGVAGLGLAAMAERLLALYGSLLAPQP